MAFILLRKSLDPQLIHLTLRTTTNLPELVTNDTAEKATSRI